MAVHLESPATTTATSHEQETHYTPPSAEESAALAGKLALERGWYAGVPRFATTDDVHTAITNGTLQEVTDSPDIRRIGRFNHPESPEALPYLLPRAVAVVGLLGEYWRESLAYYFGLVIPGARLAITSMVRSGERQQELVEAGALAVSDSTHATGGTFDVDVSGYYMEHTGPDGCTRFVSVTHPGRGLRKATIIARMRARSGGNVSAEPDSGESGQPAFDWQIMEAAMRAARQLYIEGRANVVPEFVGTPNACYHVATNPAGH